MGAYTVGALCLRVAKSKNTYSLSDNSRYWTAKMSSGVLQRNVGFDGVLGDGEGDNAVT
jgi:hypothetical protein